MKANELEQVLEEEILKIFGEKTSEFSTYEQVQEYAIKLAKAMTRAVSKNADEILINTYGTLDYDFTNEVFTKLFKSDYDLLAKACKQAQTALNNANKIHIKAILPTFDDDRAHSIIWEIVNKTLDEFRDDFPSLSENFLLSIVDDAVRENADFQFKSGQNPMVIRKADPKCCKWCSSLEGTYLYEDVKDKGNAVFKRHQNCRCSVTYVPKQGKKRDVWQRTEKRADVIQTYLETMKAIKR